MSPPFRSVPQVGQPAEVVDLGARRLGEIVRVDGRTLWVRIEGEDGEHPFDLHPTTANFVARGQPYWGTRLRL